MQLKTNTTTERNTLEKLAKERLRDFDVLRTKGNDRFAAAIYLGGYAVECLLKAHICKNLDSAALPVTYKSHNLMALLLHSGLYGKIQGYPDVHESLKKLDEIWNPADEVRSVRYIHDARRYGKTTADDVNTWLKHRTKGVAQWLRKQL